MPKIKSQYQAVHSKPLHKYNKVINDNSKHCISKLLYQQPNTGLTAGELLNRGESSFRTSYGFTYRDFDSWESNTSSKPAIAAKNINETLSSMANKRAIKFKKWTAV
jgi:hypothetical protein